VKFQFVIFTQGNYFTIPDTVDIDLGPRSPGTVLAVEASDSKNGVVHFWSLKKFRERLKAMKDVYNNVSTATEHSDGETEDPFYDDFPWFRLIGRLVVSSTWYLIQSFLLVM
jgi:kinesin family protein 1